MHASGSFEVALLPLSTDEHPEGAPLARIFIDRTGGKHAYEMTYTLDAAG
jgi:hypothetical protein